MTWQSALEIVVARTGHTRFVELCADEHPDHLRWRRKVMERAGAPPGEYPSAAIRAASLGRALWDWAVSGFASAGQEEVDRRLAICRACPQWDGARCRICGCYTAAKVRLLTERCPLPDPRW